MPVNVVQVLAVPASRILKQTAHGARVGSLEALSPTGLYRCVRVLAFSQRECCSPQIAHAAEHSECLMRQFCGPRRSFQMAIGCAYFACVFVCLRMLGFCFGCFEHSVCFC